MTSSDPDCKPPLLEPVLAVVGVGLIGGSFAAAARASGAARQILGTGRDRASLQRALELGLIDKAVTLPQALEEADMVMLATPVGAAASLLETIQPLLGANTVLTDAGSTKLELVHAARRVLGSKLPQFVPGHPIAGAERAGPEAADAGLFLQRHVVLTPTPETDTGALARVQNLWTRCGARVMSMPADRHDRILASVSHVPHGLAAAYMWQVATATDADERLALAGSGFRDFTRIAAGSPEVWRDIFLANRQAVLQEFDEVRRALDHFEQLLHDADASTIEDFLERAALARRLWAGRAQQP